MNNNNMSDDEFEEPDDDADYEEYCGEDECTVVSGVSKESTIASHLLDLDANVPADEESDDEDLPTPMLARDDDDDDSDGDDDDISSEDEEEDEIPYYAHVVIYTSDELLELGLKLIGYTEKRLRRAKHTTNVERFKAHFSSIPKVLCDIWEDLQTTDIPKIWVPPSKRNIKHFLMSFHFLKRYPTEFERECISYEKSLRSILTKVIRFKEYDFVAVPFASCVCD
jgi:hypothetical protein